MITKNMTKFVAVCIAFVLFPSLAHAITCEPALLVVRHAEDTENGEHKLVAGGIAHAEAYKNDLPNLLTMAESSICPPQRFFSSDRGSPNPLNTVLPSAGSAVNVISEYNGKQFFPEYNWESRDFLQLLKGDDTSSEQPQSILMALSKQSMWDGKTGSGIEYKGLFKSILNNNAPDYDSMIKYLAATKPAPFNLVYVFKFSDQDPISLKFNKVTVYLQVYNQPVGCRFRIPKDVKNIQIVELAEYVYGKKYENLTRKYECKF